MDPATKWVTFVRFVTFCFEWIMKLNPYTWTGRWWEGWEMDARMVGRSSGSLVVDGFLGFLMVWLTFVLFHQIWFSRQFNNSGSNLVLETTIGVSTNLVLMHFAPNTFLLFLVWVLFRFFFWIAFSVRFLLLFFCILFKSLLSSPVIFFFDLMLWFLLNFE